MGKGYDWQAEDRRQEREYLKRKKEEERQKIKEEPNFRMRLNALIIFQSKEREQTRRGGTIRGIQQGAKAKPYKLQYRPNAKIKKGGYGESAAKQAKDKKWKRTIQNEKIIDPRKVIERWIERTYKKYGKPNPNRAMENLPEAKTELPYSKLDAPNAEQQAQETGQEPEKQGIIDWDRIIADIADWYREQEKNPDIFDKLFMPLTEFLDSIDKKLQRGEYAKKNNPPPKAKPLTQHQSRSEA